MLELACVLLSYCWSGFTVLHKYPGPTLLVNFFFYCFFNIIKRNALGLLCSELCSKFVCDFWARRCVPFRFKGPAQTEQKVTTQNFVFVQSFLCNTTTIVYIVPVVIIAHIFLKCSTDTIKGGGGYALITICACWYGVNIVPIYKKENGKHHICCQ